MLHNPSREWRELRYGLCGDVRPASPFVDWRPGFGNRVLERDRLAGYRMTATIPSGYYMSHRARGAFEVDDLTCVEEPADPCADIDH